MLYINAGSIYHAQETPTLCGAAVALTMLSDKDSDIKVEMLDETVISCIGHHKSAQGWEIDPGGLAFVLNNSGSRSTFAVQGPGTEPEGTACIVAGVAGTNAVAVAALIQGRRHWVSVNGIEVDKDPFKGSYILSKLWVFDPEANNYPTSPHADNDNCPNLGVPDYCVFYCGGWQGLFTGTFLGSTRHFISIVTEPMVNVSLPGCIDPPSISFPRGADGLIAREAVDDVWRAWLEAHGGWPEGSPGAALAGSRLVGANKVKFLEGNGVFFLSRFEKSASSEEGESEVVGSCIMDAQSGRPQSVKLYSATSSQRANLERLREELANSDFVWMSCLESFSPHLPFRVVEGEFERLDRRRFEALTSEIRGA